MSQKNSRLATSLCGNHVIPFPASPLTMLTKKSNKYVKGDSGAIGVTEFYTVGGVRARDVSSYRWISNITRVREVQAKRRTRYQTAWTSSQMQEIFRKHVKSVCETIEEMGNPFIENTTDALVLDTHEITDPHVAEAIRHIQSEWLNQYQMFVFERIDQRIRPLSDSIKENNHHLFSSPPTRTLSKDKQQIASLKQNCALFCQFYVTCQTRDGDLDDFFRHEN